MKTIEYHLFGLNAGLHRPPPLTGRIHHHQEIELNYLFSGGVTYLHAWGRRRLPLRRLVAFWGSAPHCVVEAAPRTEMAWLTVPLPWLLQWHLPPDFTRRLLDGNWCEQEETTDDAERYPVRAWVKEINRDGTTAPTAILLELQAAFVRLAASSRATPTSRSVPGAGSWHHVEKMARFMTENFADPIDMGTIAAAAKLHRKYATTLFRRWCGLTPGDYLRQVRLTHAQRLLITSDAKVIDVAAASGFESLSAFYEGFQRLTRATPGAFRKRLSSHPN